MIDGDAPWKERCKTVKVHRLVLLAFSETSENFPLACHRNGIKTDNRLSNLYWGTRSQNAQDSIKSGTFVLPHPGVGEKHHQAKYSNELIAKIRCEYTGKRGQQTELGKKYGMPQQHVSKIVRNELRVA
jgi:hypothetical protein